MWVAAGATLFLTQSSACSGGEPASSLPTRASAPARSDAASASPSRRAWRDVARGSFKSKLSNTTFRVDEDGVHIAGAEPAGSEPSFSLVSIGRDPSQPAALASPYQQDSALLIERGIARERIELSKQGIEQSWEFSTRPAGVGDLLVRLKVADMQIQGTKDGGLRFLANGREISYGAATWVDATGKRLPVSTRYHAGFIELTVPAKVIDESAYPALLDPTISSGTILMTPERVPGGRTGAVTIGCNTSTCLVAWTQDGYPVARRVQLDGKPLDTSVIPLAEPTPGAGIWGLNIAATPDDFLVTFADLDSPNPGIKWTSIDATNGAISDAPPKVLGVAASTYPATKISAYTNGVQYLVYRERNPERHVGLRLVDGQVVAPAAGVELGPSNGYDEAIGLVPGPNQFGYVQRGKLQRISASTGALLDGAPIEFSKYGYTGTGSSPAIAYDGANYVIVWFDAYKLQATRVRASDGVVLDPDDDFNELPGSRVLCTGLGSSPTASIEGGKLYVTWSGSAGVVATSFPMAPWAPSAAACDGPVVSASAPTVTHQVGAKALQSLSFLEHLDTQGIEIKANGTAPITNAGPVNYHAGVGAAFVASNGRDFMLTATHIVDDGKDGALRTFALAVDGVTGAPSAYGPQEVSGSQYEALPFASAGNAYLIPLGNSARRVSCDGKIGPAKPMLPGQSMYGFGSDDARYFVVTEKNNEVYGYRIDADGTPIDDAAKKLVDGPYMARPLVAGNTAPDANLRTFTALTLTSSGLTILRMRSATGAVLAPIVVDTGGKAAYPSMLVGDGTNLVLGWTQPVLGQDPEFWTARFDPTTGAVSDKKLSPFEHRGSTSFDGTSYVEMWQAAEYQAYMRRQDASYTLVDPSGGSKLPTYSETHGSNRFGRTLLVNSEYLPQNLGHHLVGYFVDNDLAAGDPDNAPATCIPEDEGGAGGAGGADGGAGGAGVGGTLTGGTSNGGSQNNGGSAGNAGAAGGEANAGAAQGGDASGGEPNQAGGAPSAGNAGEPSVSGGTAGSTAGTSTNGGTDNTAGTGNGAGTGNSAGTQAEGGASNSSGNGGGTANTGGTTVGDSSGSKDSSGCGCRVTPKTSSQPWVLALGAIALLFRRRRTESSAGLRRQHRAQRAP